MAFVDGDPARVCDPDCGGATTATGARSNCSGKHSRSSFDFHSAIGMGQKPPVMSHGAMDADAMGCAQVAGVSQQPHHLAGAIGVWEKSLSDEC